MGRAQQKVSDHFTALFGSRRGSGRGAGVWPPPDGARLLVTLPHADEAEDNWQLGPWSVLAPHQEMAGRLWCEDGEFEGWINFKVQVNPPTSDELHSLIQTVTGTKLKRPGTHWLGQSIPDETRRLAVQMAKRPFEVRVRVNENGEVSVARWLGRALD